MRGRLRLWQPKVGYRFSVDPLLLCDFVVAGRATLGRVVDLGTGSGIVALALAERDPTARVVAVEVQPRLAALARRNAVENALSERVEVAELDLAEPRAAKALPGAAFELAVSNPPFRSLSDGPPSPNPEEAVAKHELRLSLPQLVKEARRMLVPGGRLALVYPAERLVALVEALQIEGLRPSRARFVHDKLEEPARRVLFEAEKGGRGACVVERPFLLRRPDGTYTDEAKAALGEPWVKSGA